MGLGPREFPVGKLRDFDEPVIVNALGMAPTQFAVQRSRKNVIVVTEPECLDIFGRFALAVSASNSFSRCQNRCQAHYKH